MQRFRFSQVIAVFWVASLTSSAHLPAQPAPRNSIVEVESVYADFVDALDAIETIDSGLASRFDGKDRPQWQRIYRQKRTACAALLAKVAADGLTQSDARAVAVMRRKIQSSPVRADRLEDSMHPSRHCRDAERKDLSYRGLRDALYACFDETGNQLEFEGARLTRLHALDLLSSMEDFSRRKALFLSFVPLWQAINGNDEPGSPYRRLIAQAAADARKHRSAIDQVAAEAGVPATQVEDWLEQILEAWSEVSGDQQMEPWDFRYQAGEADRALEPLIPRGSLQPITERYYRDLGADLERLGVLHDLDPRPGKAPLAYSDVARSGRTIGGVWRSTVARVSANYEHGGLGSLNEFVHENGHAVHYAALRTRPAFMDVEPLFDEAFADVTSWDTYEPAWQRKYLGHAASAEASLASLYSSVALDVAWSLFEIKMLRQPDADPNQLWSDIASRYLHIVPHPEWAWWAVRVQLVESPGYMLNYGLGSVITADLRRHIQESLGTFETGNPSWYNWVSERLLRFGLERPTPALLREFLGRAPSPEALLMDIRRLKARRN